MQKYKEKMYNDISHYNNMAIYFQREKNSH